MSIQDVLKGCPLFFEMYDEEIDKVVRTQKVHHFAQGETIVKEGGPADQIFVLLEGIAELHKETKGGRIRVERLKQGEVFGMLVLLDKKPYTIGVVAATACAVLEIKHDHITDFFSRNPRIVAVMTLNLCRILGHRLRGSYSRMAQIKVAVDETVEGPAKLPRAS